MISISKLAAILLGSFFIAIGVNYFLMPFQILDGGVIGIALIIHYLTGVKVGLVVIFFSIPIFLMAWYYYRDYFYNSLHGMLISSYTIDLLEPYHSFFVKFMTLTPLTSATLGGFLVGTGLGIMLKYETSAGGTDLLAQFLAKYSSFNVGIIIFFIDAIIICLGGLLFSSEVFFLSLLTITAGGMATSIWTINKSTS